jgi:hypothetical protein
MRISTIGLLVLFLNEVQGQNFTSGSVYNYNVGDTIIYYYRNIPGPMGNPEPYVYHYRVYKTKTPNSANDTIIYTYEETVNNFIKVGFTYSFITTTETHTQVTSNFSVSVINFTIGSLTAKCGRMKDTSYIDVCKFSVHRKYLHYDNTCFEPSQREYTFIEGIGQFYLETYGYNHGAGFEFKFVAAHKAGQPSCGGVFFANAINELSAIPSVQLFPNPGAGLFILQLPIEAEVYVYDLLGNKINLGSMPAGNNQIDLSQIENGIYFLVASKDQYFYRSRLIKE